MRTLVLLASAALLAAPAHARGLSAAFGAARKKAAGKAGAQDPVPEVKGAAAEDAVVGRVDHYGQFQDLHRDQGDTGACHAFAGAAVLEAAYFRRYGEKIRLSAADLFLQKTVQTPDIYRDFIAEGKAELSEPNWTDKDIQFALDHGAATTLQFKDFLKRYKRYRGAEERTIADIERRRREMSPLERLFYDPRRHWAELQQGETGKRILEAYLTGNDKTLERQRADMKEKLSVFKLETQVFDGGSEDETLGWTQYYALLDELDAGRPAAVASLGHAFLITGYTEYDSGSVVFDTLDSQGNEPFHDYDCWAIQRIMSVVEK